MKKFFVMLSIISVPSAALAFDLGNVISDGLKVVAPIPSITIQIIGGKDPSKAATDTVAAQTRVIVSGLKTATAIDQGIEDKIKQAVGKDLGKVIEIVRLPEKLERASTIQTLETVGQAMDKQRLDLKALATTPFAAALQQAIDLYQSRALPLPPTVVALLSATFEPSILSNGRFVIDDNLGSLPGIINFMKEQSGDNHAVTVGNIIVFAKDPGIDNIHFWAHEIQHTVQYSKLGVSGFAAKYSTDYAEMEKEAETVAAAAEGDAAVVLKFLKNHTVASK